MSRRYDWLVVGAGFTGAVVCRDYDTQYPEGMTLGDKAPVSILSFRKAV